MSASEVMASVNNGVAVFNFQIQNHLNARIPITINSLSISPSAGSITITADGKDHEDAEWLQQFLAAAINKNAPELKAEKGKLADGDDRAVAVISGQSIVKVAKGLKTLFQDKNLAEKMQEAAEAVRPYLTAVGGEEACSSWHAFDSKKDFNQKIVKEGSGLRVSRGIQLAAEIARQQQ